MFVYDPVRFFKAGNIPLLSVFDSRLDQYFAPSAAINADILAMGTMKNRQGIQPLVNALLNNPHQARHGRQNIGADFLGAFVGEHVSLGAENEPVSDLVLYVAPMGFDDLENHRLGYQVIGPFQDFEIAGRALECFELGVGIPQSFLHESPDCLFCLFLPGHLSFLPIYECSFPVISRFSYC